MVFTDGKHDQMIMGIPIFGLDVKITVCLPGGIDSSHFLKHFQKARLADR